MAAEQLLFQNFLLDAETQERWLGYVQQAYDYRRIAALSSVAHLLPEPNGIDDPIYAYRNMLRGTLTLEKGVYGHHKTDVDTLTLRPLPRSELVTSALIVISSDAELGEMFEGRRTIDRIHEGAVHEANRYLRVLGASAMFSWPERQ
jgi:hypothetical protein